MMHHENVEERVRLCAARSLGLSENMNDALVLMESFIEAGILDISIPGQSIMKSISGDEFITMLQKALIQFDDDGGWIDITREEVEERGGVIDDLRGEEKVFYRIANEDGSIPAPPVLTKTGDRIVIFHTMQ